MKGEDKIKKILKAWLYGEVSNQELAKMVKENLLLAN